MAWEPEELAKTKQACLDQGNQWEKGECQEVSVLDYCSKETDIEQLNSTKHKWKEVQQRNREIISACYRKHELTNYMKDQVLDKGYSYIFTSDFISNQSLSHEQIDKTMDLIEEKADRWEGRNAEWRSLSSELLTQHELTPKQKERVIKKDKIHPEDLRGEIPKNLIDLSIDRGDKLTWQIKQDLTEDQLKKAIDNRNNENLLLIQIDRTDCMNQNLRITPKVIEYGLSKGLLLRNYMLFTLIPQIYQQEGKQIDLIDKAIDLDHRYDDLYDAIGGAEDEKEKITEIAALLEHLTSEKDFNEEDISDAVRAINKYKQLSEIFEHAKLTPYQVKRALKQGQHITQLLSYQSIHKKELDELIRNLNYDTKAGKNLFQALWANKDLPKDCRKKLSEIAGLDKYFGGDAHFVWYFINPKAQQKVQARLIKAIDEKIEENPLEKLVGDYSI